MLTLSMIQVSGSVHAFITDPNSVSMTDLGTLGGALGF